MADDDSPDNVLQMPRIGSPPPPPVPPPPTLDGDQDHPAADDGAVRISAFDAPAVPHAPPPPDAVPAALRSDGLSEPQAPGDAGPPRTGALSLAAILAIALAAFEGLQTWIQESGPRRAEAAAHQRELELLAAKATADATRHHAEADREHARGRRVPSSHDYGRSTLGRGPGGAGRASGGIGPGRAGTGRTGPHSGSTQHRSGAGPGGRPSPGTGRSGGRAGAGPDSRRNGPGSRRNGPGSHRNGPGSDRNGSMRDRNSGGDSRRDGGSRRRDGSGNSGGNSARRSAGSGSSRGSAGTDGSGRRSARRAVADWWSKGKKRPNGPGPDKDAKNSVGKGSRGGSGAADTKAALRNAVKASKPGPTFWEKAGDRIEDRWRKRRSGTDAPTTDAGGKDGGAKGRSTSNDGWTPSGDRVGFREAVFDAVNDRWKKRRERWTTDDGTRPRPNRSSSRKRGSSGRTANPGPSSGPSASGPGAPGPGGPGAHPGYGQARSSPFDADTDPRVTITVEQVDPPGTHAKRWEPTAIGPAPKALPAQSQPALPRAPQRPAGPRPGTTRRKDPIPMPARPARTAAAPAPVTASVPAPGGMAAQHATDITLDDALKALTLLTTAGMETYDDCAQLARQARRLLNELETMAADLATTHNVSGKRTTRALSVLMESVGELILYAERMARAALAAAETAEAEETAMARDYRPTQDATVDAGLAAPSARIHNEN
ncbi:hypothetical protein [Streptomyces albogriseolus]|uniref:hypothetical protein n=1 Tax=Streptomyces albogriseolus TaxID=1887 RepID=UPI0022562C66|nr:hypothetical protein [Streptomyces viridodiastaticus]MCX4625073.1 hypothetical protein [Streptomyces viridodiastaticus]